MTAPAGAAALPGEGLLFWAECFHLAYIKQSQGRAVQSLLPSEPAAPSGAALLTRLLPDAIISLEFTPLLRGTSWAQAPALRTLHPCSQRQEKAPSTAADTDTQQHHGCLYGTEKASGVPSAQPDPSGMLMGTGTRLWKGHSGTFISLPPLLPPLHPGKKTSPSPMDAPVVITALWGCQQ